ncbi:MAG: aminopeptidase N, partial [Sciscionella sp.]|nr:aminopeptidase N [Sciscionella sp.]
MTSLTREDARERAEVLAVDSYDVNLDLNLDGSGGRYFGSVSTIRFNCAAAGESTFVDIAAHEIRSATLNGRSIDPASAFSPVTRRLTLSDLAEQNELSVDAVMKYSHDGEGLHRSVDPADGQAYLYAMSFLDAAPRWFACFDQPDLKAPVTIDVRCPADWHVAGNGPAQQHDAGRWT